MKSKNNVFTKISYLPWGYIRNWPKNVALFFRRFKWAYQRATRGFANCDVWDMDAWYMDLFSESLNYFADNHWGFPGNEEFPDDETWTKYLKEMAHKFYIANESNDYYPTPEGDKWYEWLEKQSDEDRLDSIIGSKTHDNPYGTSMFIEECENDKKRDKDLQEALEMFSHVFRCLWD